MNNLPISFREVWKAKKRINSIVAPTPLIYSEPLSEHTGNRVYLKLEQSHPTGSFKLRGAANKILSMSKEEQIKGVTTFSTGNHGISVAYVAKKLAIPCTVCISNRVPAAKVNRLKKLGATVEIVGRSQDNAETRCIQLEEDFGMTIIKPFDDKDIIAGQGTIGLEIMEQCPEVKEVVIPLSGGGLLSGIGLAMKSIDPAVQITGVSMERAAVMYQSLQKGKPVILEEEDTLADSLLGGIGVDNRFTLSMTKAIMDKGKLVSEEQIKNGLLTMLQHHKMAVEGAAATGVGLLLGGGHLPQEHTVLVISGNNVDHSIITDLMKMG